MVRGTIEIAKITQNFTLKFGLILEDDAEIIRFKAPNKLISKYQFDGNDYLRISPHPFIVMDITSKEDRKNNDRLGHSVTLNRRVLFAFIMKLKKLIASYTEKKDLFYYDNDELFVDREISTQITLRCIANNNNVILMQPCVVVDEEHPLEKYEGCAFCINRYANFVFLTYMEMGYLLYELERINMTQFSLDLIKIYEGYKDQESEKPNNVVIEKVEEELSSVNVPVQPREDSIPDI